MSVPQNKDSLVCSTPHITLPWFYKQAIVGVRKGAQKSPKEAMKSKATSTCVHCGLHTVQSSLLIRPFTAFSALLCFWSCVTEKSLLWLLQGKVTFPKI